MHSKVFSVLKRKLCIRKWKTSQIKTKQDKTRQMQHAPLNWMFNNTIQGQLWKKWQRNSSKLVIAYGGNSKHYITYWQRMRAHIGTAMHIESAKQIRYKLYHNSNQTLPVMYYDALRCTAAINRQVLIFAVMNSFYS